ncbi:hypothetical protein DRN43_04625 [Thermococci archaeon]|nr:MAG: hypothetical protein DRN43_04625 [Thermococci archaeon]
MKARKTIKCGVVFLTKHKQNLLDQEYDNFQHFLQTGEDLGVYSAHKQQARRFYKKIKKSREYPISIRNDLLKIEKRPTKIVKYWARIPVKGQYGGVWVAIKPHEDFPDLSTCKICESKLYRKNGKFYLNVTVEKEVNIELPKEKEKIAIISIDIGERNPITYTVYAGGRILDVGFEGREIRSIRWHYLQRRREIGKKKVKHALRVIKKIGHKERNKVRDILHKATSKIVRMAENLRKEGYTPIIVIGDIKHVRKPREKGKPRNRKLNRMIHSMPSYQVKHMLQYKALWREIPVMLINEAHTSQLCWRCGALGRVNKRRFFCPECGLDYNRDLNGSRNILKRSLGYMLGDWAVVNQPVSPPLNSSQLRVQSAGGEATDSNRW